MRWCSLPLISAALAAGLVMTGCSSAPPVVKFEQVKVAIPVGCQEPEPARPQMPTDQLPADVDVDTYVQAAEAEIHRREGYEIQLRQALANCKQPIMAAGSTIKN